VVIEHIFFYSVWIFCYILYSIIFYTAYCYIFNANG